MAERRGRGRPRKASAKSASFNTRITPELRAELERAANARGVSLSEEIEARLARSFEDDAQGAHGAQDRAALRVIGEIMRRLDTATQRRWSDDPWLFGQFEQAVAHTVRQWRPEGEPAKPNVPRFAPEDVDRLGRYMAENVLVQLDFTEPDGTDPFARIKADLGDLANRGGGQ